MKQGSSDRAGDFEGYAGSRDCGGALSATAIPLAALAGIALAGLADLPAAGYLFLGAGAGIIAVVAPVLLWRSAATGGSDRGVTLLAVGCVFVLGACLASVNTLRAIGADEQPDWMTPWKPIPGTMRVDDMGPDSMTESPMVSPGPEVAMELLARGAELEVSGSTAEAIEAYREGLLAAQAGSHADLAASLSAALSKILLGSGDPAGALAAAEDGIAMSHRSTKLHGGVPAEDTVRLHLLRGLALAATGDAGAVSNVRQALELCDEHHGANLELRNDVFSRLADLLRAEGSHAELADAIAVHAELSEKASPPVSPSMVAKWREEAGRILGALDRLEESAGHFEKAAALRDGDATGDPIKAAFTRVNLARSLLGAGRPERARNALGDARKVLDERLPPDHDARRAADSLSREIAAQLPK